MSRVKEYTAFVDERPFVEPKTPKLLYAGAAMAFEAGEAGDVIKKMCRGDIQSSKCSPQAFLLECGDVLYYMTKALSMLGYTLDDAMEQNMVKLRDREKNGYRVA
jgi:hypothetical protein